jgi:predicted nuclease with TOPRIM domain
VNSSFSDNFYRPIVFNEVKRTVWPPSWLGHTPFAFWLMEVVRPSILVELGTHTGNSFSAFCQAATYLNYQPSCFAIDTWEGDPHAGLYGEEVFSDLSKYIESNYRNFATLLRSTFNDSLDKFSDGTIDILNIDGYHTYEATKENFESWLPKVKRDGIILIHDTNVRTLDFGAWKFWEEIKDSYPSFSFLHGHGLGVVCLDQNLKPGLKELFSKDEEQISDIRNFFSNLGSIPEGRAHQESLKSKVASLEAEKNNLSEQLSSVSSERDKFATELHEVGADRGAIESKLHQAGAERGELERRLHEAGADRGRIESRLHEVGAENSKLLIERLELQSENNSLKLNLKQQAKKISELLVNLENEAAECGMWRDFVKGRLGQDVNEARFNLDALLESNQIGLKWKDVVSSRLGDNLEQASELLHQFFVSHIQMNSKGHREIAFVKEKVRPIVNKFRS